MLLHDSTLHGWGKKFPSFLLLEQGQGFSYEALKGFILEK